MSLQSSGLPAGLKHSDLSVNGPHIEPEFLTEDEARRRREQLNRRPSYRMILKDLETVGDNKTLKKEIDESGMDRGNLQPPGGMNNLTSLYVPPSSNGTMHGVNPNASPANDMEPNSVGSSGNSVFSPRTLTELPQQMPVSSEPQRLSQNNNVMVHPNDLLSIKPVNDSAARTAAAANFMSNDWPQNLLNVYSSSTSPMGGVQISGNRSNGSGMPENDDSNRKRQVRLLKNREAAKECRRKKKEYVKCLENRVAVLENQNKALIEELKTLKELYCRKEKAELS
uniref:BZIP domain-containing protein n=1 Tax=Panagrolaimus superbus TaxID=310955 RepID=A0A914YK79_9BILA